MSEFNVFAEKAGFTTHFKIVLAEGESLSNLLTDAEKLIDWMGSHGYKHDSSRDRKSGGKPPKAPPTVKANGHAVEVKCGDCQGPVWDNRQENDKRERQGQRRRPDFSCKDKDGCGWVCWDAGTLLDAMTGSDDAYEPDAIPFE